MLVLTRKAEEEIVVVVDGTEILLKILRIQGNNVSIGFDANPEVVICRKEVYSKTHKPKQPKDLLTKVAGE